MRRLIQSALRSAGINVQRYAPHLDEYQRLLRLAASGGATVVLDVGANEGQFGATLIRHGWAGKIMSFEPLSAAHEKLSLRAARHHNWIVAQRCAIGDAPGTATINVAGNSESSSLRPMLDRHARAAPHSVYVGSESVDIRTLDDLVPRGSNDSFLLKIDVQGYEREVLKGAQDVLRQTSMILTEMSLQPLYSGEATFLELSAQILELGYRCVSLSPAYVDPVTYEVLQVDGVFVRAAAS